MWRDREDVRKVERRDGGRIPKNIIEELRRGYRGAGFMCCRIRPPERDVIWTEAGGRGAHRFGAERLWRLISEAAPKLPRHACGRCRGAAGEVSRAAHKTVNGGRGHRAAGLQTRPVARLSNELVQSCCRRIMPRLDAVGRRS